MGTLAEHVERLTGMSYADAVAFASGAQIPDDDSVHRVVAQALANGWDAAAEGPTHGTGPSTDDPFAALAADAPLALVGAA